MGEGEETIVDLVKKYSAGDSIYKVPGFYARDGFVKRSLEPIDTLSFPERDELEIILRQERSIKEAYVSTTRGCHNACSFCSIPPYYKLAHGPSWRERSVERVCSELESLLSNYPQIESVSFVDDNFLGFKTNHQERGLAIAKRLHELNRNIVFEITCRVDSVDHHLFSKLAEYGLSGVYLGIESGVQRILNLFRKNTTVENNLRAIDTIAGLGIGCDIGFIMFCPTITLDEVKENLLFLKSIIEKYGLYVHPATVFRNLKTYPTDLGLSALDLSEDSDQIPKSRALPHPTRPQLCPYLLHHKTLPLSTRLI
ncbi:MAG: radical SAM protein [Nitrospirae bacterium]|nr:radical SAM protein [Nitrospirota bacterium]